MRLLELLPQLAKAFQVGRRMGAVDQLKLMAELEEAIPCGSKHDVMEAQPEYEKLLVDTVLGQIGAKSVLLRFTLARCLVLFYTHGHQKRLHNLFAQIQNTIGTAKTDAIRLANLTALGTLAEGLPRQLQSYFTDSVSSLSRLSRSSDVLTRVAALEALLSSIRGAGTFISYSLQDVVKLVGRCASDRSPSVRTLSSKAMVAVSDASGSEGDFFDVFVPICIKGLSDADPPTSLAFAQAMGRLMAKMIERAGGAEDDAASAKKRRRSSFVVDSLDSAIKAIRTLFFKSPSPAVCAGLTEALVVLLQQHPPQSQQDPSSIASVIFSLASFASQVSSPVASSTIARLRKDSSAMSASPAAVVCASYLIRHGVVLTLPEKSQVVACQALLKAVSSSSVDEEHSLPVAQLLVCLVELGHLFWRLGCTAKQVLEDALQPVMALLSHRAALVRMHAGHALRMLVRAVPSQAAMVVRVLHSVLSIHLSEVCSDVLDSNTLRALEGHGVALAGLMETVSELSEGVPQELLDQCFGTAKALTLFNPQDMSSKIDQVSTTRIGNVGWLLLASLISLGTHYSGTKLKTLFSLWKENLGKKSSEFSPRTQSEAVALVSSKVASLTALRCFAAVFQSKIPNSPLLSPMVKLLTNVLSFVKFVEGQRSLTPALRNELHRLRALLLDTLVYIPPAEYSSRFVLLLKMAVAEFAGRRVVRSELVDGLLELFPEDHVLGGASHTGFGSAAHQAFFALQQSCSAEGDTEKTPSVTLSQGYIPVYTCASLPIPSSSSSVAGGGTAMRNLPSSAVVAEYRLGVAYVKKPEHSGGSDATLAPQQWFGLVQPTAGCTDVWVSRYCCSSAIRLFWTIFAHQSSHHRAQLVSHFQEIAKEVMGNFKKNRMGVLSSQECVVLSHCLAAVLGALQRVPSIGTAADAVKVRDRITQLSMDLLSAPSADVQRLAAYVCSRLCTMEGLGFAQQLLAFLDKKLMSKVPSTLCGAALALASSVRQYATSSSSSPLHDHLARVVAALHALHRCATFPVPLFSLHAMQVLLRVTGSSAAAYQETARAMLASTACSQAENGSYWAVVVDDEERVENALQGGVALADSIETCTYAGSLACGVADTRMAVVMSRMLVCVASEDVCSQRTIWRWLRSSDAAAARAAVLDCARLWVDSGVDVAVLGGNDLYALLDTSLAFPDATLRHSALRLVHKLVSLHSLESGFVSRLLLLMDSMPALFSPGAGRAPPVATSMLTPPSSRHAALRVASSVLRSVTAVVAKEKPVSVLARLCALVSGRVVDAAERDGRSMEEEDEDDSDSDHDQQDTSRTEAAHNDTYSFAMSHTALNNMSWRTKVTCLRLVSLALDTTLSRGCAVDVDMAEARRLRKSEGSGEYLVLALAPLIKCLCQAATSQHLFPVHCIALRVLHRVLEVFGDLPDPDLGDQARLMEQYEVQIKAALKPALTAEVSQAAPSVQCVGVGVAVQLIMRLDLGAHFARKVLPSLLQPLSSAFSSSPPTESTLVLTENFAIHTLAALRTHHACHLCHLLHFVSGKRVKGAKSRDVKAVAKMLQPHHATLLNYAAQAFRAYALSVGVSSLGRRTVRHSPLVESCPLVLPSLDTQNTTSALETLRWDWPCLVRCVSLLSSDNSVVAAAGAGIDRDGLDTALVTGVCMHALHGLPALVDESCPARQRHVVLFAVSELQRLVTEELMAEGVATVAMLNEVLLVAYATLCDARCVQPRHSELVRDVVHLVLRCVEVLVAFTRSKRDVLDGGAGGVEVVDSLLSIAHLLLSRSPVPAAVLDPVLRAVSLAVLLPDPVPDASDVPLHIPSSSPVSPHSSLSSEDGVSCGVTWVPLLLPVAVRCLTDATLPPSAWSLAASVCTRISQEHQEDDTVRELLLAVVAELSELLSSHADTLHCDQAKWVLAVCVRVMLSVDEATAASLVSFTIQHPSSVALRCAAVFTLPLLLRQRLALGAPFLPTLLALLSAGGSDPSPQLLQYAVCAAFDVVRLDSVTQDVREKLVPVVLSSLLSLLTSATQPQHSDVRELCLACVVILAHGEAGFAKHMTALSDAHTTQLKTVLSSLSQDVASRLLLMRDSLSPPPVLRQHTSASPLARVSVTTNAATDAASEQPEQETVAAVKKQRRRKKKQQSSAAAQSKSKSKPSIDFAKF